MNRISRRTLIAFAAAALIAVVVWIGSKSAASDAPITPAPPPVSTAAPSTLAAPAGRANAVATAPARLVKLAGDIQVVGTVSYDQDHLALVGPLVSGRVARLVVGVGDRVRRGQILAEIESAEVGQARADLIAARARAAAAELNLHRESELAERRISSTREKEVAEAQWITERAAVRAATERLRALGLQPQDLTAIEKGEGGDLGGRLPMRAPIDGLVLERGVTLGQAVERATDAFKIADTAHVWINLDVYEKDLPRVQTGGQVEIRADAYPSEVFKGRVAYVVPVVEEATRTAKVRVELANDGGKLSFGQLVTARLVGDPATMRVPVLAVPRAAIQRVDGRSIVFVQATAGNDGGVGFEARSVELGVSTGEDVEVRRGIKEGELVASDGAFLLKSELLR
ncbi:MAG TPA: efflux RND transporter periplasmic adaptor subunit [Polyangia bacterium]|nr:efflux RND transporter periplasmic adaptor subunit [Polyangia bacterium]